MARESVLPILVAFPEPQTVEILEVASQVMQIYQMDAMNFHFVAHPIAWVVHRPHPPSSGYNHTFTGEAYSLKHKPTDHLWKMERIAKVSAHPLQCQLPAKARPASKSDPGACESGRRPVDGFAEESLPD